MSQGRNRGKWTPHSSTRGQTNRSRYNLSGTSTLYGKRWYRLLVGSINQRETRLSDNNGDDTKSSSPINRARNGSRMDESNQEWLSLTSQEKIEINNLVVCQTDSKDRRWFARFRDHLEFYDYMSNYMEPERSFYEVIRGPRKPIFDIDVDLTDPKASILLENGKYNSWNICIDLVRAIEQVMDQYKIDCNFNSQLLWFQSNDQIKHSYHLVIDRVYHTSHHEAEAFYRRVIQLVNPLYRDWIDSSVYSSVQQFRILGSQKTGSNRPKVHIPIWSCMNNKGQIVELDYRPVERFPDKESCDKLFLSDSLVSFISKSRPLPSFGPEELFPQRFKKHFYDGDDRPHYREDQLESIIDTTENEWVKRANSNFPFRLLDYSGNRITLKRTRPGYCLKCNRVHDNQNAFLTVSKQGWINFHCFQDNSGGIPLFKIDPVDPTQEDQNIQDLMKIVGGVIRDLSIEDEVHQLSETDHALFKALKQDQEPLGESVGSTESSYVSTSSCKSIGSVTSDNNDCDATNCSRRNSISSSNISRRSSESFDIRSISADTILPDPRMIRSDEHSHTRSIKSAGSILVMTQPVASLTSPDRTFYNYSQKSSGVVISLSLPTSPTELTGDRIQQMNQFNKEREDDTHKDPNSRINKLNDIVATQGNTFAGRNVGAFNDVTLAVHATKGPSFNVNNNNGNKDPRKIFISMETLNRTNGQ